MKRLAIAVAAAALFSPAAFAQQGGMNRDNDRYGDRDRDSNRGQQGSHQGYHPGSQQGYSLRPGDADPYANRPGAPNPYATTPGAPNPYATRGGDPNSTTNPGSQSRGHRSIEEERGVRAADNPNSAPLLQQRYGSGGGAQRR
jgi:hypothetical protein